MAPHTAVVTGATGFVATELVKQLLNKGYNVRGTVRSASDTTRLEALLALGKALPGQFSICEADLLTEGSFDAAVKGADYVFHVASPFKIEVEDPDRDLVQPAVQGTLNVLGSVLRNKATVKRVVITSSVAGEHIKPKGINQGRSGMVDQLGLPRAELPARTRRSGMVTARRCGFCSAV